MYNPHYTTCCLQIFLAEKLVPAEAYTFFIDILLDTIRDEIAACIEKSYIGLKPEAAAKVLNMTASQLQAYAVKVCSKFFNWSYHVMLNLHKSAKYEALFGPDTSNKYSILYHFYREDGLYLEMVCTTFTRKRSVTTESQVMNWHKTQLSMPGNLSKLSKSVIPNCIYTSNFTESKFSIYYCMENKN